MTRRAPAIEEVVDGGWVVTRMGDPAEATELLHDHVVREGWADDRADARTRWPADRARTEWLRKVYALPNSWAAGEGCRFYYHPAEPHARGAFQAVCWWT